MKNVSRNIPILFEEVGEQVDSRFLKVKIWLMHTGKNYNNSIFTREAVIEAMDSLKNTPILGYVEESELGNKDFRGHETKLVVKDGDYDFKYIGQAFGTIPETCNPRFETKLGDYGEELEYLVVDGLLWTKLDDAVDILKEKLMVSQSMELHKEYDGYFNDEGYFVFTKFKFYGACLLGEDVSPAMQNASVEIEFSTNEVKDTIARKLEEYYQIFNKNQEEVHVSMNLAELLAKYSLTEEDLTAKELVAGDFSIEELEVKIQELFTVVEEEAKDKVEEVEPTSDEEGKDFSEEVKDEEVIVEDNKDDKVVEEEFAKADESRVFHKFALSHDDVRNQLWSKVNDYVVANEIGESYDFWIHKVYDNYIIMQNEYNNKLFKVEYSKENDEVLLGTNVEVFASYLTSDEKGALELMRSNFTKLEEENVSLKAFQKEVLSSQHEEEVNKLFSNFSKLDESDLEDIKENIHNFTVQEIEAKLFERLGRKMANFSKPKEEQSGSIRMRIDTQSKDLSSVDNIFIKHGIKK